MWFLTIGNLPWPRFTNALGKFYYSQICTCSNRTGVTSTSFYPNLWVIAYPWDGMMVPAKDMPTQTSHSAQQNPCLGINIHKLCSSNVWISNSMSQEVDAVSEKINIRKPCPGASSSFINATSCQQAVNFLYLVRLKEPPGHPRGTICNKDSWTKDQT